MAWARVREERQPCGRKVSRWVGAGVFTQGRACGSGWRRCRPPAAWASAGLQMCAGSSRPGPHPTHRGALSKAAARRPGRPPGSSLLALRPTRLLQPGPKSAAPLCTALASHLPGGAQKMGLWGGRRPLGAQLLGQEVPSTLWLDGAGEGAATLFCFWVILKLIAKK